MREVNPTRSAAIELADERRLMRQGYEFLDEKRMLLAAEMLRQLRLYQERSEALAAAMRQAGEALAAAVERHGLDQLQVHPVPEPPASPETARSLFLGLPIRTAARRDAGAVTPAAAPVAALDPSPEAKACRAAFDNIIGLAAETGALAGNLARLAREYRRTERRAKALEKVLLPEVEDAIKRVEEQLDTMDREETIRTRWSSTARASG